MKVLCDREQLREGLTVANSVIPIKSTRPAVENVYLVATDDALELVGTDLEVAVRYRIDDVKVEETGTALIPSRVSSEFVRDLSGETVTIEAEEEKCVITSGSDRCQLAALDPDEFPAVDRFSEAGSISLQGGNFTRLVKNTSFAAAKEHGRYAMHGILTLIEKQQLKMVATDGRRLSVSTIPLDTDIDLEHRAIIPTKGMQLFCRVISDPLENIRVQFGENQFGLKTRQAEIFARMIDGEFPRYSAVIPQETTNRMEADRELLAKKLRLVSNVASADTRAVRLSLSKGRLDVFAKSAGTGEASAQMEVVYDGDEVALAFNPDYVMDGLKNCETNSVMLDFTEKTSPGKFTLGENYVYVVMPITIDV